jgi:hypothetical protein
MKWFQRIEVFFWSLDTLMRFTNNAKTALPATDRRAPAFALLIAYAAHPKNNNEKRGHTIARHATIGSARDRNSTHVLVCSDIYVVRPSFQQDEQSAPHIGVEAKN